jgi:hypothetical protein
MPKAEGAKQFNATLHAPLKHVDKSQKQLFTLEIPPNEPLSQSTVSLSVDRRHFLPSVFITGIAKQQKDRNQHNNAAIPSVGELSLRILSREDKEVTFLKCDRCQEKDAHIFEQTEPIKDLSQKQLARHSFALIGVHKIILERGKASIPIYFRCCPTHHTSKKADNFVKLKIIFKTQDMVYESDFVSVQWKVCIYYNKRQPLISIYLERKAQ